MRISEVKEYLKEKYPNVDEEELMKNFDEFMTGQTVSIYPDGESDYYKWDVERFRP